MTTKQKHVILTVLLVFLTSIVDEKITVVLGDDSSNTFVKIPLGPNQIGPEAIAFDCKGDGPYVGISDGRILKWRGEFLSWTLFAVTASNRSDSCDGNFLNPRELECGRPLGLRFDMTTCELYIADSSFGLMKVGRKGGVATVIASSAQGIPFALVNALDIDSKNKVIYFSDSSAIYRLWEFEESIKNNDTSGRLLKYDMKTGHVTVLLTKLFFANGVAISKNNDFVFVAESGANQIRKYWLSGHKKGTFDVIKLNEGPDNINRNSKGDFWVALLRTAKIKINHFGEILETVNGVEILNCSDVTEFNRRLWFGFFDQPYIYYRT